MTNLAAVVLAVLLKRHEQVRCKKSSLYALGDLG